MRERAPTRRGFLALVGASACIVAAGPALALTDSIAVPPAVEAMGPVIVSLYRQAVLQKFDAVRDIIVMYAEADEKGRNEIATAFADWLNGLKAKGEAAHA